jgi:hypothetical protein
MTKKELQATLTTVAQILSGGAQLFSANGATTVARLLNGWAASTKVTALEIAQEDER